MTENIVWEEPPTANRGNRGRGKYEDFFDALRANPGRWGRIPTDVGTPHMLASQIKKGELKGAAEGQFEAVARKKDEGQFIYARYVGQQIAPSEAGQ